MPPSTYISLSTTDAHVHRDPVSPRSSKSFQHCTTRAHVSTSWKILIPELPTLLPDLSDDVPRTIFAYLAGSGALSSGQGHTCVCWNWCDLIYAMNTLWSTIMVDGMFYVYFCNRQTCSREQPVGQSIHAGIERSRPANTRLSWDSKGLVWHGCNRFGSPRRPLRYLAKKR